ncbi:MAG TPA: DUF1801 domain-containing protein [Blastocatellia bacterium]|nr:DUF1801 domain-containing protein [Blastocatellia bacterium]
MKEIPPPSEKLIEYLSTYDIRVGELALRLREILIEEAPDANEIVFKSYAVSIIFSYTEKWTGCFCYVGVSSNHVNLGFNYGALLDDPYGVMEGTGKQMRHIKIKKPEDLEKPYLREYIQAAIKLAKPDKTAKPARKSAASKKPTASRKRRAK